MSITPINAPEDKPRYKQLSNGATYDYQTHRIVAIDQSKNPHAFTSETARQAVVIREQERAEAIAQGMMDGTDTPTVGKALQAVIACQTRKAVSDHNRSTEAARLVLQVADVMPDKQATPQGVTLSIGADVAKDMLQAILQERERRADIVDMSLPVYDVPGVPADVDDSEQASERKDARDGG